MTDRCKPSFGFWATIVVLSVPLLYVLSFPAACWLVYRDYLPDKTALVYRPLLRAASSDVSTIAVPLRCYGGLFTPDKKVLGFHPRWRTTDLVDHLNLLLILHDAAGNADEPQPADDSADEGFREKKDAEKT